MWPSRFGPLEVEHIREELGPYMASGRLQQMPVPDKGGIFQRDWWQVWESPKNTWPETLEYKIASLDGAFTEKEENDPSAMTVWGIFTKEGKRRVILMDAWAKHLQFSGPRMDKKPGDSLLMHKVKTGKHWGLLEWTVDTCNRWKVDKLLIEAKGPGESAAQEIQNRYGLQPWAVQTVVPKGDKVARALAVQPTFSQELVYRPVYDWSEMVVDEMAMFPKGKHDDLVDSTTQALKYLRDVGLLSTDEESYAAAIERVRHKPKLKPLYPV